MLTPRQPLPGLPTLARVTHLCDLSVYSICHPEMEQGAFDGSLHDWMSYM